MRRTDPLPGRLLIHPFTVTVRVTTSILVRLGTFGIGNFGANVTLGESGPPCLPLPQGQPRGTQVESVARSSGLGAW